MLSPALPPPAAEPPLRILYQDERLIAIDKPSGLLVHRSDIDRRETRFAVQLLRDQIGRRVYPAHRLDRGTSGVLLFAFDSATARELATQFEARLVEKTYLAVVRGHPPESGLIDHPLTRRPDDYEYLPANATAEAQPALTRFRRLAVAELPYTVDRYPTSRYALLELTPETGRRHQLRRHLKHLSHPIIGDATYGKGKHNRLFQTLFGSHRMLLACTRLCLAHPSDGSPLAIEAELSGDYANVLNRLGWNAIPTQRPLRTPLL